MVSRWKSFNVLRLIQLMRVPQNREEVIICAAITQGKKTCLYPKNA
jgi:hypothetical protein